MKWPIMMQELPGDDCTLQFMDMASECGEEDMNYMMSAVSGSCMSAMMTGEGEQNGPTVEGERVETSVPQCVSSVGPFLSSD